MKRAFKIVLALCFVLTDLSLAAEGLAGESSSEIAGVVEQGATIARRRGRHSLRKHRGRRGRKRCRRTRRGRRRSHRHRR